MCITCVFEDRLPKVIFCTNATTNMVNIMTNIARKYVKYNQLPVNTAECKSFLTYNRSLTDLLSWLPGGSVFGHQTQRERTRCCSPPKN